MGIVLKKTHKFFILFLITVLYSCNSNIEFTEYNTLQNSNWKSHEKVSFIFEVTDTIKPKNLFINIRNNNNYPFSNLYVITELKTPNGDQIIDTLHYAMTDAKGKFLGNGFANLIENKLFYKEQIKFATPGEYQFNIRHAMRKNGQIIPLAQLEGIQDIGFSIEK
ncbi:gliding motility lipoprotein GldH [Polaribacter sp.]|uniref:gliding motility lipoprotein GldH n=1 Tax=Polaribacter sp. TaxID=1920175 RepID=UPI0025EB484B|nr:gliding motility lipoprotein GldH [Polaribacter sp.]